MKKSIFTPEVLTEIKQRLDNLTGTTTPKWGEMEANQMLKHLQLAFQLGTGELKLGDRSTFLTRTIGRHFMLSAKVPSQKQIEKNPPNTYPEIDIQLNTNIKVAHFDLEKEAFLNKLNSVVTFDKENFAEIHPLMGKMKYEDWGHHMYAHINYHLTQFGV